MVGQVSIFVPTVLPDWQNTIEDSEGVSGTNLSDCPSMTWSGVVFPATNNADRLPHSAPSLPRITPESRPEASFLAV